MCVMWELGATCCVNRGACDSSLGKPSMRNPTASGWDKMACFNSPTVTSWKKTHLIINPIMYVLYMNTFASIGFCTTLYSIICSCTFHFSMGLLNVIKYKANQCVIAQQNTAKCKHEHCCAKGL